VNYSQIDKEALVIQNIWLVTTSLNWPPAHLNRFWNYTELNNITAALWHHPSNNGLAERFEHKSSFINVKRRVGQFVKSW